MLLGGSRRCGDCHWSFSAETQEQANEMYNEHVAACHPEAAAMREQNDTLRDLCNILLNFYIGGRFPL